MTPGTLLQILIALGAILALWNKQRVAAARSRDGGAGAGQPDPDAEERTRRVQAEIRRKIAQRGAWEGAPADGPSPPAEMPAAEEPLETLVVLRPAPQPARQQAPPAPLAPTDRWAPPAPMDRSAPPAPTDRWAPPRADPARDWLSELRETSGARRAIVLREILGPPVGLK